MEDTAENTLLFIKTYKQNTKHTVASSSDNMV